MNRTIQLLHKRCGQLSALLFILLLHCTIADAQSGSNTVEVGGTYHQLTSGYPTWNGGYFRGTFAPSTSSTWGVEAVNQQEFGDRGTYVGLSHSRVINEEWYWNGAVGTSAGGFFYPRVRVDGSISRKLLAKQQLATTVGGGSFVAKDGHHDHNLSTEAVYYLSPSYIVQAGVRWNFSNPGSVISRSQFIALTEGRANKHYLTLRVGFGHEGYQAISDTRSIVGFESHSVSATYRQWIGSDWGVNISADYYKNPLYQRTGTSVGFFKSF